MAKFKKTKSMGKIAHKKVEIDGHVFHSKMESQYYLKLKKDKDEGKIKDFTLQPEFILQEKFIVVDGRPIVGSDPDFNKIKRKTKAETVKAIKYIADFLITDNDGILSVVDTKGLSTTEFELKKKLFFFKYPEYKLDILIFNEATGTWDDFYIYNKELKAKRKENKALREAKKIEQEKIKAEKLRLKEEKKALKEAEKLEKERLKAEKKAKSAIKNKKTK